MDDDGDIIRRSLEDPEAFREVFERHFDALLAYACRRVGPVAGEEIASETFVAALKSRGKFDTDHRSARPWLLGIATNLIRHHLRDERTHLAALGKAPVDVDPEPPDDPERMDAHRLGPALSKALLSLPDPDRETFLLVALGELTYEQAAEALGIPIGTIRSRIHRARRALRELLGEVEATTTWEDGNVLGGDR